MAKTDIPPDIDASDLDFVQLDEALVNGAIAALAACERQGLKAITAESCTGGLLATVLSEAPGAADYFDGGFIVYTPKQKCLSLNIDPALIDRRGTVDPQVAAAMAQGALACSEAQIAVAITGVAGPEPDERGNPIGLVYIACARSGFPTETVKHEFGDIGRSDVRYRAAEQALRLLETMAGRSGSAQA